MHKGTVELQPVKPKTSEEMKYGSPLILESELGTSVATEKPLFGNKKPKFDFGFLD